MNESENPKVFYSEEWKKARETFGINEGIGPNIPVNIEDDCCPHGNHSMSGCTDCDNDALNYVTADSIVCDLLDLRGKGKPDYSLVWGGRWIVVLIDKGDDDPYLVCLKRDSDGKWYRGAMKSIESSLE